MPYEHDSHSPNHQAGEAQAEIYRQLGQEPASPEADAGYEQRIRSVVHELTQLEHDSLSPDEDGRKHQLRRQLHDEGAPAARLLLAEIRAYDTFKLDAQYRAINLCATAENTPELAKHIDGLSSFSPYLSDVTVRLGIPELVPHLEDLSRRIEQDGRHHTDRGWELYDILKTLAATAIANQDPQVQPELDRAVELCRDRYEDISGSTVTIGDMAYLERDVSPSVTALRHAERFYSNSRDPDFFLFEGPLAADIVPNPERSEVVNNLFAIAEDKLPGAPSQSKAIERRLETMAYQEENASPLAVTLGIEVEIYAPTILPPKDVFLRWPKDQRADYIYQKLGGYHQSKAAGVPRDKDGLWEFANRPVHHYLTLSREVQALMRLGLMNPEKSAHPMHLTVGGVTSDGPAGAEADILARSLEATGWCSSSSRMLKPATGKESWIQKGDAGIKERERDEIALSGTRAIEIRTMEHQGLGKLDRSLRSIYALGSALRAYQGITEGRAPSSDDEQALADVWREFSSRSNQLFTDQGLDSPTGQRWTGYIDPEDGIKMDGNFYQFGQLLKDAEADPQSPGGRFQDAMQDLVISARKEALAILERTAKAE